MEHKWLRLFVDGKWTGSPDRTITVNGVQHDMDEYAKQHDITLPNSKTNKQKTSVVKELDNIIDEDIKTEEKHADMEHKESTGHNEEPGDGDSQSTK